MADHSGMAALDDAAPDPRGAPRHDRPTQIGHRRLDLVVAPQPLDESLLHDVLSARDREIVAAVAQTSSARASAERQMQDRTCGHGHAEHAGCHDRRKRCMGPLQMDDYEPFCSSTRRLQTDFKSMGTLRTDPHAVSRASNLEVRRRTRSAYRFFISFVVATIPARRPVDGWEDLWTR